MMERFVLGPLRRRLSLTLGLKALRVRLEQQILETKMLTATLLVNQMKASGIYPHIRDAEFKVFSQFGEDGIIQYLIHHCKVTPDTFIEFGVESYEEANTRFLLLHNNWSGLVIDGSKHQIERITTRPRFWLNDLTAVAQFITRENVNDIFRDNGFSGPIGLLSIDVDGVDYWLWQAIDSVQPVIVVIEYNNLFGPDQAVTVPYDPAFQRTRAHHSNLYFGASLRALVQLGEEKGYVFVGSNSAGHNAFFVHRDHLGPIQPCTIEADFVPAKFREERDENHERTYRIGPHLLRQLAHMPIYDVAHQRETTIGAVYGFDTPSS